MSKNPRTPIPPRAKEALDILTDPIHDRGESGYPRTEARQLLCDDDTFDRARAEQAIHQLLMRGYLYEVDEQLFVTPE